MLLAVLIITVSQELHQHSLMAAAYGLILAISMYSVSWWMLEYRPALRRFATT